MISRALAGIAKTHPRLHRASLLKGQIYATVTHRLSNALLALGGYRPTPPGR